MHKRKNMIRLVLLAVGLIAVNLVFFYRSGLAYRTFRWQDFSQAYMPANGTWECWDDGNGNPCRYTLNGMAFANETDGWAVGMNGTILHWDGSHWANTDSPVTSYLYAVDAQPSTEAWAVGSSGTILHWNGGTWTISTGPTLQDLYAVKMLSWDNGWAVGGSWSLGSGVVIHWDGFSWTTETIPSTYGLNGVDILDNGEGWAVGQSGAILHRYNGVWAADASPTSETLQSVSMVSATDGWAVGYNGVLLHWNGAAWQLATNPDPYLNDLYSVQMLSASDGWASGFHGAVLHWNGSQWSDRSVVENAYYLEDIEMLSANSGWMAGGYGDLWRWDGSTWQRQGRSTDILTDISLTDAKSGWAVGGWPDAVAYKWDGSGWKSTPLVSGQSAENVTGGGGGGLTSVDALSTDNAWAGSVAGGLFHWDGQHWSEWASPVTTTISSLDTRSDSDAWATVQGEYQYTDGISSYTNGSILHWDGSTWSTARQLPENGMLSIFMLDSNDGWAAGYDALLRWDGSLWVSNPIPFTQTEFTAVNMLSASDGWAFANGQPLRWDGVSWQAGPTFEGASYGTDLAMVTPDNGWMIGSQGKDGSDIQHWDGVAWHQVANPASHLYLQAISMVDAYEGWAVGWEGIILHYTAPRPMLSLNYEDGAPGSFFTVTGANYPPNQTATIFLNGHTLGNTTTDASGGFTFILSTDQADLGSYKIVVTVNPSASADFVLRKDAPTRTQEGTGTIIAVPTGIALQNVFVPLIVR